MELVPVNYNELPQNSKVMTRFKQISTHISVEPIIIFYQFVSLLAAESIKLLYLQSACYEMFPNFGKEFCIETLKNNTDNPKSDLQFQEIEDFVKEYKSFTSFLPSAMLLVVGVWSDKKGRRKICLLLPLIAELFACAGLLLSDYFMDNLTIEIAAIFDAIFSSLRDGSFIMCVYSYIGANTSQDERTLRIGIASFIFSLSTFLGKGFRKEFDDSIGHSGILSLAVIFYIIGIGFGYYRLDEQYVDHEDTKMESSKNCCMRVLKKKIDKIIILQKRENYGRLILILLLIVYIFAEFPSIDDDNTIRNYTNAKFDWTVIEFKDFKLVSIFIHLIGLAIVLLLFIHYFGLSDPLIGIIACCASITTSIWYAFAQNESFFILGSVVGALRTTKALVIRSMASQIFPDFQQGKVQMLFEMLNDALLQSLELFSILLMTTSNATLEANTETIFLINAGMTIIAIIILLLIYILQRKISARITKENSIVCTTLNGIFQFKKDYN